MALKRPKGKRGKSKSISVVKMKSGLSGSKKKLLGVFLIIAFVAFGSLVATWYLMKLEIDIEKIALVAIAISLALLLLLELGAKIKKPKRK